MGIDTMESLFFLAVWQLKVKDSFSYQEERKYLQKNRDMQKEPSIILLIAWLRENEKKTVLRRLGQMFSCIVHRSKDSY